MKYGLGLILLYTRDITKAKDFYTSALNLEFVPQLSSETFAFLQPASGTPIALQTVETAPEDAGSQPGAAELSFAVDDVNTAWQEWKDRGLDVTSDVYDMGAGLMFSAKDPDGRRISVHQLYSAVSDLHAQLSAGASPENGPDGSPSQAAAVE